MTNVLAPYSESKLIYDGYSKTGMINDAISFIIPVYNNMPDSFTENPNILETDFKSDNTRVYADVSSTLNVRTGPSTSYEVITSVDRSEIMTRIAKGKQSGDLWDKVKLSNGIIGYVFHEYLVSLPDVQIKQINVSIDNNVINKGESKKLNVEILPEEAKNLPIEFISSNTSVATVDSSGNILALKGGETSIKVKSKLNDVSSSEIKIQVYSKVTDLVLDKEKLVIQVGDKFEAKPVVLPDDASNKKVIFSPEDKNIADVDETGIITAINQGNTKITVQTEESNITKQIAVEVLPKLTEDEIIFDKSLKVNLNEVTGWDINDISVKRVKELITTKYRIEIYNNKGELLSDEKSIGTGSIIKIIDENGVIKMEYEIIIYGDVNGDGKINSVDLLVLQRHILEIEILNGPALKAGNINRNGKNPSSLDLLIIQRHILDLQLIEQ